MYQTQCTLKANCPEQSYMPHEYIRDRVFLTDSEDRTFSLVVGQIPPLAMVAAITAADWLVTSTEQHCTNVIYKQNERQLNEKMKSNFFYVGNHYGLENHN